MEITPHGVTADGAPVPELKAVFFANAARQRALAKLDRRTGLISIYSPETSMNNSYVKTGSFDPGWYSAESRAAPFTGTDDHLNVPEAE